MDITYYYDEFLDYLKGEKDVSKHTIKNYNTDFKQFVSFLKTKGIKPSLHTVTTAILRRYVAHLKTEKNYATYTIRRRIHSLSSYYKFLIEQGYLTQNPMLPIHAPKAPDVIPKFLSETEIEQLLKMPEKLSPENALRNKVILMMFLMTGMRRQELLALDWEDIDFGEKMITVKHAKGKKQRIIPITEPLLSELWKYLQTRLPITNHAVFISQYGNRLSATPLSQTIRRYMKYLGLDKKGYTIHTLRHTYASHLALNGVSILSIQKLLGHSDLNSSQVYAHVNTNHLRTEVQKLPFASK
ncbi:tyrosine-type recombinase/integrase [Paramaledivibacter caminithermalis]|jgi:site-specific recombinase XerD|uniref:Integrase/recombinase XerD n=1 Tax=Paramaledivibacter caminithermalis (strain DSM 15212 / CIP 107654 / DViRD3) TaxID=1121301 RepID=A0A1M6M970_PARC5|nr:tyrosine-type recombinase/integrase [Paramaledivibacter caminithermalis]SHJ80047.1 integrase/recombinase XerD [Paramaledivibacter caminithermalis DSM 15212]